MSASCVYWCELWSSIYWGADRKLFTVRFLRYCTTMLSFQTVFCKSCFLLFTTVECPFLIVCVKIDLLKIIMSLCAFTGLWFINWFHSKWNKRGLVGTVLKVSWLADSFRIIFMQKFSFCSILPWYYSALMFAFFMAQYYTAVFDTNF